MPPVGVGFPDQACYIIILALRLELVIADQVARDYTGS